MYIAHSANEKYSIPEQTYTDHVSGVYHRVLENLNKVKPFVQDYPLLCRIVIQAAIYHDMGKLCDNAQDVLKKSDGRKMPNHVDAGVAYLLSTGRKDDKLAAWIIHAHHRGYDKYPYDNEYMRDDQILYDRCPWIPDSNVKMSEYTNKHLNTIINRHNQSVAIQAPDPIDINDRKVSGSFMRLALSLLVESDHFDTARNYKNFVPEKEVELKPDSRLEKLDIYVAELQANSKGTDRDRIKQEVYEACRNSDVDSFVTFCASEVGTGKTTAMMAYALRLACKRDLHKIVYVAPFTNIISQTVEVFRKSICLDGENPKLVVGEHHHQVDYDADDFVSKILTTTWNSAIVCTTAVQFFETLAGCRTGRLKKYAQLAGSVVVIDESHCSLPTKLWPITLKWVKWLVENMNCYVIFASGSLTKPWEISSMKRLSGFDLEVPAIIPNNLSLKTLRKEEDRVEILYDYTKLTLDGICSKITSITGSKVVVCNTIKNAARIAKYLTQKGCVVEHLSTCLTPADREVTLERVKKRLQTNENWVLVATSCIEAGVDLSFQYGFRENAGLLGVRQLAGRVNRNNEFNNAKLFVFELLVDPDDGIFTSNQEFSDAAAIFRKLYWVNQIGPQHSQKAFELELQRGLGSITGPDDKIISIEELLDREKYKQLKDVSGFYRVINSLKVTVIIDETILPDDIADFDKTKIVRNSVQIYDDKLGEWPIQRSKYEGFYLWKGKYDDFLGYMTHFV